MASRSSRGMAPTSRRGMKEKELEQGGGGRNNTVMLRKGGEVNIQFLEDPDEFLVYNEHQWQEDGKWHFVPCAGDECPLCDDESDDRNRRRYTWAANVYSHTDKKVLVFKAGKDVGQRVYNRYKKKPARFKDRVLTVAKFATQPISHEVTPEEDIKPIKRDGLKLHDLDEWLQVEMENYYGDEAPKAGSLEDDGDDEKPGPTGTAAASDCPKCGEELDDDGECENPDCDWEPGDPVPGEGDEGGGDEGGEGGAEVDLDELGKEADDADDDAIEQLRALAKEHELDEDEYATWALLAKAIGKQQAKAKPAAKAKPSKAKPAKAKPSRKK